MNDVRKKQGMNTYKFLFVLTIAILLSGNNKAMANQNIPSGLSEMNEQQQLQTITGVVVDATGEPIIGASVLERGTTNGTITDIDGKFTMSVNQGATLIISYVGYKTQDIRANRTMRVTLAEDSELLQEVVVVGYGAQKRENLTGAVSSVDVNKTLTGRPIADVGRGLQGTTPGLSIVIPSGEVGSDPLIKIRGQIGSIEGSTKPLILLDNVEIPSILMVNPDDIESISVLKDAASASIYGSKAAFGVILITTKKGASQESVNVSYSGSFSWENISKKMEMAGFDGLEYSMIAAKSSGGTVTGAFVQITDEGLERAREWNQQYGGKLGVNDPYVYGRDWYVDANNRKIGLRTFDPYDYMIKEWAPSTTHNVSVNGKTKSTSYNISLGYLGQSGLMKPAKHDDFKRYNASVRLSTDISKYITVRAGAMYSKREKRYAYATNSTTADPWLYLYRWGPSMPLGYDEDGHIIRSPHSEIMMSNTASRTNDYKSVNFGATINITPNWKVEADYNYSLNDYVLLQPGTRFTAADSWVSAIKQADGSYRLNYYQYTANGANPDHIYRRAEKSERNTLNISSTYDWKLNDDHVFKFLLGGSRVTYDNTYSWAQKTHLMDITNPQFDLAIGTQTSSGGFDWDGQVGFFGRVNYSFKERYLLEANLRYDATSKFPSHLQWRWFPSFSAGWRLSEESFMQWSKPFASSLKFRGSYGVIGDQTVPNGLYVSTMKVSESMYTDANGKKMFQLELPTVVAQDITWQDIATLDFGFDARFLDGRLGLTFDWYQRDTKNMIIPGADVTYAFGIGAPKQNFGGLRTTGWEVSVDYAHRFNNGLSLNGMFMLSDAISEITDYSNTKIFGDSNWYIGKKYGEIWGYVTERLYQADDFVWENGALVTTYALNGKEVAAGTSGAKVVNKLKDSNGIYQDYFQSGNYRFGPGDPKFTDLNGDGNIHPGAGTTTDPGDRKIIGNSAPRYEYGFRLGAEYKGFDFSVFFQGIGKRDLWGNGALTIAGYHSADGAMPQAIAENYWREDRTDAFYPRAYPLGGSNNTLGMQIQDRYLLNMSYLRMKNLTFGYSLPKNLIKKAALQKARVYVALENFLTFDNLNGLPVDPEEVQGYSMFNDENYNSGRTGVGTPTMKSMSVGIQLNF